MRAGSRTSQGDENLRLVTNAELPERSNDQRRTSSGNVLDGKPFPALAEEDSQEAVRYDGQRNNITAGMQSNYSSETAGEHLSDDRLRQPKKTASGHVRSPMFPCVNMLMLQ